METRPTGMPASAGYSPVCCRRRSKTDWAGIALGDAFKSNVQYYVSLHAQRMFYGRLRKVQRVAAMKSGACVGKGFEPAVKPQISACYTTYPKSLACYAAIGHTAFLEFWARHPQTAVLWSRLETTPELGELHQAGWDPETIDFVTRDIVGKVHTRLLLHELSGEPALASVEIYRLFCASQQNYRFRSFGEIAEAVILYGDVLPDISQMNLHPATSHLLREMEGICARYHELLPNTQANKLADLGVKWALDLSWRALRCLLPAGRPASQGADALAGRSGVRIDAASATNKPSSASLGDRIAPLDDPAPPQVIMSDHVAREIADQLSVQLSRTNPRPDRGSPNQPGRAERGRNAVSEVLQDFMKATQDATAQKNKFEDIRADVLETTMRHDAFSEGPIQGRACSGHHVRVAGPGAETAEGGIFDRTVEQRADPAACRKLLDECAPIAEALRRVLYPSVEHEPLMEKAVCTGGLDPARLAVAEFCLASYRRFRRTNRSDRRGRPPVLLIACDSSASLSREQMQMTKLLAAAWLVSTVRSGVQLVAGVYHSGNVRDRVAAPLVEWLSHPYKTPAGGRMDAIGAVASLPDAGSGAQSDALSISFMLDEARQIARGRVIYFILISDCVWNHTPKSGMSGLEEVQAAFGEARKRFGRQIHTTLVALSPKMKETGLEGLVDKTVAVSPVAIGNPAAVAQEIGVYVASCMKERK